MKSAISGVLLVLMPAAAALAAPRSVFDFAVYAARDINAARSDYQGSAGAGRNVSLEDFSIEPDCAEGDGLALSAAGEIALLRGNIGDFSGHCRTEAGGPIDLRWAHASGSLTGGDMIGLDHARVDGPIFFARGLKKRSARVEGKETRIDRFSNSADHERYGAEMARMSLRLAGLPGVHGAAKRFGQEVLSFEGRGHLNVFAIGADDLDPAKTIEFTGGADQFFIVNVRGHGADLAIERKEFSLLNVAPDHILFNFTRVPKLYLAHVSGRRNLGGPELGFAGSILAPETEATFIEGLVTGSLWLRDLDSDVPGANAGQVNRGGFKGWEAAGSATAD